MMREINTMVKVILTRIELPAMICLSLSFEVRINLMCAFFNKLLLDISKAATRNMKMDHMPNSFFVNILAKRKKFKKPNKVLEKR
jgi:hypothetical protein